MGNLKPIKELFDFEKGQLQSSKNTEGNYTFITAAEEWKTHESFTHDCEALIFAAAASGSLGRTHYYKGKFIASDLCFVLTPKEKYKDLIDLKFYHTIFNDLKEDIVKKTSTGTSKVSINRTNFGAYEIPFFDKEYQETVRNKLENVHPIKTKLSSELQTQLGLINKLRSSILSDAVSGKLVPQDPNDESAEVLLEKIKAEKEKLIKEGKIKKQKSLPPISEDEIPYQLPDGWVWCRLAEILNTVRGGSPRPAGDKKFYDGNIPFLKIADLTKDKNMYVNGYTSSIKEAGLNKTRYIDTETLMLTNSGATLGIPKICKFPTTFNDGIAAFIYMNNELYKPFFYYLLKSKTRWFLQEASRGQGQPNLNTDIIGETLIGLPPFAEQKRIVEKVEKLMAACDALELEVQNSKIETEKLMQSVLKEAFKN